MIAPEPKVRAGECELLPDVCDPNAITPLGPHVDAFEAEMAAYVWAEHAVAFSSGTAGLHLGMLVTDDEICAETPTMFAR